MNLQDLQMLVDYHYWARDRMLEAVAPLTTEQYSRTLGSSFASIRDTVVHIFGAEWVWLSRWEGGSPTALPDPSGLFPDVASIRAVWTDHEQKLRAFVGRLDENAVQRPIAYYTFDGKAQAQPLWQMLQHVVNHGSYHRGQVTTLLRQIGASPPKSLDLIAFYRERAAGIA